MTKTERDSLISGIKYLMDVIAAEKGSAFVEAMCKRLGVREVYTIPSSELWNVYGEFHQVEADLR